MQVDLNYRELRVLRAMLEERIVSAMDADVSEAHVSSVFRQNLFEKLQTAENECSIKLPADVTVTVDNVETKLKVERDGSLHLMPQKKVEGA